RQRAEMPGETVGAAPVIIAELLRAVAGGFGADLDPPSGRVGDPGGGDDPAPVPGAAAQIGLADLEQVARPQKRAAAEIAFAVGGEVPVPAAELERPGDGPLEIFGQPGARRRGEGAADQIDVGRAIS